MDSDTNSESEFEFGNFELVWDSEPYLTTFLKNDDRDNLLCDLDYLCFTPETNVPDVLQSIGNHSLFTTEMPASPKTNRFVTVDESKIASYEAQKQSSSTKRNTQWGINIFQDWHKTRYGAALMFQLIEKEELFQKLRKFFCEVRNRKETKKRLLEIPMSDKYINFNS
ncbi:hypothetical protein KUTeg_022324 [Tegillarca granosa]|uniref:PiggyBac transposable element-derived protein domain-containing protein n=1 Tax=Tegillarca granosa TaxID=220873 RepID=A0ABQ9EBC3_TEGGR|nr:hypothetical protein KUTeg_022324 [Tegillarca granosa]